MAYSNLQRSVPGLLRGGAGGSLRRALPAIAGITALLTGSAILPALADATEMHEYQIRRFVYLKTSCGLQSFQRLNPGQRPFRFHIVCDNVSGYPHGMEVSCSKPDDHSCVVLTEEKTFDSLELLQPKQE